ncbi:MAG: hypothetical protein GY822_07865 [Deltaproteobacteria bacterium]|nr:hypothetical protein [Deltaproteobacteria bacterium]
MKTQVLSFLMCLAALSSCTANSGMVLTMNVGDIDEFVQFTQPVFKNQCASPSCHGNDDRPLEIFAQQLHRVNDDERYLYTPLTDDEIMQNALRASLFVGDLQGGESSLLRKTLPLEVGGKEHAAGSQFSAVDDRGYQALLRWVESVHEERANDAQ